ncbi:MAG: U32 family peptidase [Firmicutes bacterium]|nr:U32 family peptidase [Bacillota bacterium]
MMPELLAPAGDLERLKIALLYGADAVYIGGKIFGLRANAINFSSEEMKEAVAFAHSLNKKVYVTVNMVLHNKEIKFLLDYLKELESIGIDAIIASDLSVISLALEKTNLEVHVSTQQSTLNYESVKYLKDLGVKRVVLGRELSCKEIKNIQKVGLDIEIFIHGAMCASYSGRCVLSNYLTNRDANRGGCSQICRWDFDLLDSKFNEIKGDKNFTFCSKDLSLLKHIKDICDMKVNSLKIEGRMRSTYYIATVVSIYRKAIDNYYNGNKEYDESLEKVLSRVANRENIVQFFNGVYDETCNYYNNRVEVSNQDFLGVVLEYDKDIKLAKIEQRNYFKKGDYVEFFGPNKVIKYQIDEIFDCDMNKIDVVRHPKQIVYIKITYELTVNDFMRINVDKT